MRADDVLTILNQIKDKNKRILFIDNLNNEHPINEILERDDNVVLGNELPTELFKKDYKYY